MVLFLVQVDFDTLLTMTEEDFKEIGVTTLGARRKLQIAISGVCGWVFKCVMGVCVLYVCVLYGCVCCMSVCCMSVCCMDRQLLFLAC